jgi:hypothetical protein
MLRFLASCALAVLLTSAVFAQGKAGGRSWLSGTWEGTGYQADTKETWTMKLTVRGRRYRIEYPSLNCGGSWVPISIGTNQARFVEKITHGIETCSDNGNVVIERLSWQQIAFRYANHGTRKVTASAILDRKSRHH